MTTFFPNQKAQSSQATNFLSTNTSIGEQRSWLDLDVEVSATPALESELQNQQTVDIYIRTLLYGPAFRTYLLDIRAGSASAFLPLSMDFVATANTARLLRIVRKSYISLTASDGRRICRIEVPSTQLSTRVASVLPRYAPLAGSTPYLRAEERKALNEAIAEGRRPLTWKYVAAAMIRTE